MDISRRNIMSQNKHMPEYVNQAQLDLTKVAKCIYMMNVNAKVNSVQIKVVVE